MNTELIYLGFYIAVGFVLLLFAIKLYSQLKSYTFVKSFSDYVGILDYCMDKAFNITYKDRILVYSLDATKLPEEELDVVSKDFVKLVIRFLGPRLESQLVSLFGNREAFMFHILDYFNSRYEDDEIRKTALDNLTSETPENIS